MGILDRIFTAERTMRLVGKLAKRQPLFVSALRAVLLQPEVSSMVSLHSASHSSRRARAALTGDIVPDAMLSRLTLQDDANPAGNVHGGVILHLCDIGGFIAASRHCNETSATSGLVPLLVQVEESEFLNPVYLGQAVFVNAKVAFASPRSLNVVVDVLAKNLLTGQMTVAHTSKLWYVAIPAFLKSFQPAYIPVYSPSNPDENRLFEQARQYYAIRKSLHEGHASQTHSMLEDIDSYRRPGPFSPNTVGYAYTELSDQAQPSQCRRDMMMAGLVMKLMDTCAGLVALRHCNSNVVTLKVSEVDFLAPVHLGEVYYVMGIPTFTSKRTIEIACVVKAAPPSAGRSSARTVVRCNFTFVGLSVTGGTIEVPPLVLETDEERARYERGKARYLESRARSKSV